MHPTLRKEITVFLTIVLYIALAGYYAKNIGSFYSYKMATVNIEFGYPDPTLFLSALDNFSAHKVPYKDYFFEYGLFFLLLYSITYILLGKTFLAATISGFIVLPIIGVITSWLIAKLVLKRHLAVLFFLSLCLLYGTNYNFVSMRHLVAELGLAFLILYILTNKTKHLAISGALAGLAVLSAVEYGISLTISVLFILIIRSLAAKKLKIKEALIFVTFLVLAVLPFFFGLNINKGLSNYYLFNKDFISNYSSGNPCAKESYPRLSTVLNNPNVTTDQIQKFLRDLNMYIIPIFYLIVGGVNIIKLIRNKESKTALTQLSLVSYGFIIYSRTLATPCTGYFAYSLIPFFLSVTLLIEQAYIYIVQSNKKLIYTFMIVIPIYWLYHAALYVPPPKQKTNIAQGYYKKTGTFMDKNKIKEYEEITNYIEANTNRTDFIYVYPWGPYNYLTKRPSPTPILTLVQAQIAGDSYINRVKNDIDLKKPKYIIVNIFNNFSVATYGKTRLDVPTYTSLNTVNGPVFAGEGNTIERYILENYETVFANKLAIVMTRRDKPIDKANIDHPAVCKRINKNEYQITSNYKTYVDITFRNPTPWKKVEVTQNLYGNAFDKLFTRFLINYYINSDKDGDSLTINEYLSKRSPEKISINNYNKVAISKLSIKVIRNTGFLGFLTPNKIEILEVDACEK